MLVALEGPGYSPTGVKKAVVTSLAATSGVITIVKIADKKFILHKLVWSYSNTPTGGGITVAGATDTLDIDVTNAGPGSLSINYLGAENTDLVVTIKSGAGAVVGKLYIEYVEWP